jgi:hypothetical protein
MAAMVLQAALEAVIIAGTMRILGTGAGGLALGRVSASVAKGVRIGRTVLIFQTLDAVTGGYRAYA